MLRTLTSKYPKTLILVLSLCFLFAAGTVNVHSVEAVEYTNPLNHEPYVQLGNAPLVGYGSSSTDQFQIIWQTLPGVGANSDSFVVEYKKSSDSVWIDAGAISTINTNVESRVNHYVNIHTLDYNTDYDYRVVHMRNAVALATYSATYHTRLAQGDTTPYTFVAYGDSASGNPPTNFISVQTRINTINPAFSILLGDNAYTDGTHSEWDLRLKRSLNSAAADYIKNKIDYFGWGNHDIVSNSGQPVLDNYDNPRPVLGSTSPVAAPVGETPEHNYSFDYGDVHFLTLDTNSYTSSSRLAAQLTWAIADLNASDAKWKVVFVHFPIVSISFTSTGPTSNYYQQMVSQLKAAGVDVLFVGHAHTYERSYPLTGQSGSTVLYTDSNDNSYAKGAGLTEVVSGLGGRDFHNGNTSPGWLAFARTGNTATVATYGVTKIDVTNNNLTISQIQASNGAVIDSFTIDSGMSATNVQPASLVAGVTGSTTVSFTTASAIPANGKIVITLPTSLGSGFVASSTGTIVTAASGIDGSFSTSVSGGVITITRSGGSSSAIGAKSFTLTNIKNPDLTGSTGVYQIKTTDSGNTTIDEDTGVTADTITPGVLASTNIQPASLTSGTTTSATVSFTTSNPLPSNGKIVLTFPTTLAGGFGFNSGGSTAVSGITGIDGSLSVSIASNVVTLTRSGGTSFSAGTIGFTLSNISNPPSSGSTGVYQIKTTNSSTVTIDQDALVSADTITAGAPVSWWNGSWQKRVRINFDTTSITANATSVPIMVALSNSRINYASTLAAGADIRFVESDNSTVLPYEIERWDTSGTSTIWVRVPQIDGASTADYIYMYYNNTGATDAQDVANVWSNSYAAVYHFAETTGAYRDSVSGYVSNSSDAQTVSSRTSTLLGNAPTFGGTTASFITVPDANTFNVTNDTIEAFIKPAGIGTTIQSGSAALTAVNPIVAKGMAEGESTAADIQFFLGLNSTGTIGSDFEDPANTSSNANISGSTVLSTGGSTPYYVASTVVAGTGGSHKVYVNGVVDGTTVLPVSGLTATTPNTSGTQKLGIGTAIKTDNSINGGFNGVIDEVRISSVTRSADWLALQNKSIQDTLNTFGTAEDVSGASSLSSVSVVPASLVTNASGNVVVSFTTNTTLPADGQIVVTFPTSLGSGFVFDSMGTTAVGTSTGFDGTFTVATSSNSITITRSGGSDSSAGAKSLTLSHIANPGIVGTTGTFSIQTKSSANAVLDQDLTVAAQTIVAGTLLGTNVEPGSPVISTAGNMTVTFRTVSGIPSNGKIVVTLPTSLGSGFTINSGGSTAATSNTIGGSLGVSVASNVITITRSGGSATTGGETESITLSNIASPSAAGSTGVYQIKTTDASTNTIDQDTAVAADTISTSGATSGWWNASWQYRKKIVFNNAAQPANLVNFPVRVVLSTTTSTYANFKANGDDVRFVDADGTTALNYEIENWNTASTSNMWVKVPQIDSASTTDFIYMYYGNSSATPTATTTGVWDSNYITVLHFGSTTATTITDSTSYGHNSDAINSTTRAFVAGAAGNAVTFSGANGTSNITLPDSNDYDMTSHTNEAYIKKVGASVATISTGTGGQTAIDPILTKGMAEAESTVADVQFFMGVTSGGFVGADFENSVAAGGTSQNAPVTGTSTVSVGTWYHIADRFDDTAHIFRAYKNGAREISSTTPASYHPSTGGTMKVGIAVGAKTTGLTSGGGFNGTIDEIRISNIARSEEWIAASSLSTSDTYNTYNAEESQGAGALSSTNVEPASLSASASGNVVVSFTTANTVASDGKIVVTLPTSLGTGFIANTGGSTAVSTSTGFDGSLTASVSGNVITVTRSGGTSAAAGAKSLTLTFIQNPNAPGSTGAYQIKTTTSGGITVDQDLAVTADTIVAATLSSTSVVPASLAASATGNVSIGFTTTNSIPVNGKIVVTFPTSLGAGFGIGSPAVVSASGISGLFTVATTSTTVTLTRTGTGNVASPGAKTIVISGITNPNIAGSTGTYQIKTTDVSSATIDQDISVASSDITGALSGNNVEPASLVAGASGNVVVSFTTGTALPSTGKILITLPTSLGAGFTLDNGGLTAVSGATGLDGTFTVSTSSNVITITRSGGTSASAGAKTITLTNIKNPVIPGSTGAYSIVTKTSANVVLEQDGAIASDTITEGALTNTNIEPASLVKSATGNVAVTFTTANPIPSNGRIYIYLPISLGDGFIIDDGGTTAVTNLVGLDGTVSVSDVNNFITIDRNGDGATSTPGVVSFTLTHIKNPNITGSTEEYSIETRTNSSITIDEDMLVTADTITNPADAVAPGITNIASTTGVSTASISWDTDENASSTVEYGATTSYGTASTSPLYVLSRTLSLTGLTPNSLYHFRVISSDAAGNTTTSGDNTFTTLVAPDVTAPGISNVASTTSITGATIAWDTDELSTSLVEYGTTATYTASSTLGSTPTLNHSVVLSGLAQNTTYHFRVISVDASTNRASSTDYTFKTAPDTTGPIISDVSFTNNSSSSVTALWNTEESATSEIAYGLTSSYTEASSSASLVLPHSLVLTSLRACTQYHYALTSVDGSSNDTVTSDATFVTSGCAGNSSVESVNTVTLSNGTGATATTTSTSTGNAIGLTVPAGYSTSTAIFQIKRIEDTTLVSGTGGVSGKSLVGDQAYDLQAYSNASTSITTFNHDLTITMSYRDADVASVQESTLLIYRFDGVSWSALSNCIVDTVLNTVTCDTNHFSTFGLYGTPVVVDTGGSTNAGGGGGSGYASGGTLTIYYGNGTSTVPQGTIVGNVNTLAGTSTPAQILQTVRYQFTRDLKFGSTGQDVKILQRFLNNNGFFIAKTGVGAPGKETELFGRATEAALKQFQITYKSSVLTPAGLTLPNGILGPNTRRVINTTVFTWNPTLTVNTGTNTAVTPAPTNTSTTQLFNRDLLPGVVLNDVKQLQQFLNSRGFPVAKSGIGSPGKENESFGPATRAAVIKFQEAYRAQILTPNGLVSGTGTVGESTRAFINSLISH